jgi:hypothetical protein
MDGILAVEKEKSLSFFDHLLRMLALYLRGIYNKARTKRRHWRALPRKFLRGLSSPRVR